jgi:hypothetical protein
LTANGDSAEHARILEAQADTVPAARMIAALQWAEANDFERAATLLRNTTVPAATQESAARQHIWKRQRLVWLAQMEARAGTHAEAIATIQQAIQQFQQAGDLNAVARWQDFARKIAWLEPGRAAVL